jgi:micrococcal nuclease
MNRRSVVLAGVTAISTYTAGGRKIAAAPPEGTPSTAVAARVIEAVDGEKLTVRIDGEVAEVRLIGVDAPEPINDDDLVECFAVESTGYLDDLLSGETVYLESDVEDKDGKDRLWRFVWYGPDSTLLNEHLLLEGTVILRKEEKNLKYQKRLKDAEKRAREDEAGLWGSCGGGHVEMTPIPRHGSGDDPGELGETLEAEGMAITLQSAYTAYNYGFSTPKGGYVYLVCEVRIENVDDENHGYRDGRFSAKDMDTDAEFDAAGSATDSPLGMGDLSPGEYVYGIVGIEIQETTRNVRVKYQVNEFGGDSVYWLISV